MDAFSGTLLAIWREVGRHAQARPTVGAVARLLRSQLPFVALVVREIDDERWTVETVGIGLPTGEGATTAPTPPAVAPPAAKRIVAWCRRGRIGRRTQGSRRDTEWAALLPPDFEGSALVGPLVGEVGVIGVALLLGSPQQAFGSRHEEIFAALLEPLTVAIENDRRLRELAALRDAAETEKSQVFHRLGRAGDADTVVGGDTGLRPVMERVGLMAKSDVPALILGETGAGKEVIARSIHAASRRADRPFIRVNCGAIPAELIDSQLFGHERGAFTGATDRRIGWFERADGGTLFLDEIGELPLAAQVRLLRVLQDGLLERVGGQEPLHVDVRIVAATHRDLAQMVRDGRFREDLWYRLAVFPILLPPLRERVEDIPALAAHFAHRAAERFGLPPRLPGERDLALLASYPWPGNVRELASVIDRATILGNGERLEVEKALGFVPRGTPAAAMPVAAAVAATASRTDPPPSPGAGAGAGGVSAGFPTLDAAMLDHIQRALRLTHGRIEGRGGAAELLGINPHTLRARMRKHGLQWSRFRERGPNGA